MTQDASSTNAPERKRIENPTCETCRWWNEAGSGHENCGECCLNPPQADRSKILVYAFEFCSHHESAFEDDHIMIRGLDEIDRAIEEGHILAGNRNIK